MRRAKPEVLVAILVVAVLFWDVWYARRVSEDLSAEATHSTEMFVRVYRAIGDPSPGAAEVALTDLLVSIRTSGVPLIWTDTAGVPQGHANLPFDRDGTASKDDPRVRDYVAVLARQHLPIADSIVGKIY